MAATKTTRSRAKATPQAEQSNERYNVLTLPNGEGWLVRQWVPTALMSSLVGRQIRGIEPHPSGGGRMRPTYDVENDGWLDKFFGFIVPRKAGTYDLSSRSVDKKTDRVQIESMQVVVEGNGASAKISRIGFGEMIESFGGTRLTRQQNGELVVAEATTE